MLFVITQVIYIYHFFDDRPGKLFDGLQHIRASILLGQKSKSENSIFTTSITNFILNIDPFYLTPFLSRKSKFKTRLEHS